MPTRYKGGVSTDPRGQMHDLGTPDPTKYISFFEDFTGNINFPIAASGLAAASTADWICTVTEGGANDGASAVLDGNGGLLELTCDINDNDLIFVQHGWESILPVSGKKLFFKTRLMVNEVIQSEVYAGLMIRDTDPLSSTGGDGVTDGIFFLSEDASAGMTLYCQKDATSGQTSASSNTLVAGTMVTLGFYWDGVDNVKYFIDGVHKGTITSAADYLPDTELTLSFGVKAGEVTNPKVLTLDYLYYAQER